MASKNLHNFIFKKWLITLTFLLISPFYLFAQTTYPVIISSLVEPPYSPYFSDYFSPATNKWKSNIIFNDFSEPSWNVKLRITIESNKVKIQTRPTFIPPTPIRVIPGVPYTVSGIDLTPYLEYNNLILNGITAGQLSQNGRLPEGFYSFCIEVLDYNSGTPLSLKSCSNFWIQLNDEPITITPVCGNVVRPNPAQNIIFQWQQASAVSPNSLGTEYQLVLYEITDPTANPLNAIQNNKVLKIFESEFINQNTFLYDMTAPILDIGKKYAYTIQARDIEGKDIFKNKGTSQPCWFYYGYPNDGIISLIQPGNLGSFSINDPVYFKWNSPSKTLSGQVFSYRIKIVKLDSTQTPEEAIEANSIWYEETTSSTSRLNGYDILLKKKFDPQTNYAWQVKAITDGEEIAKSPVYVFYGPGIIEKFLAGDHEVLVKTTFNQDLNHLNGVGLVKLSEDGKTQEVNFTNLRIKEAAGRYVLDYGVITDNLVDNSLIELSPAKKENFTAYFHPKKFKLDKDNLMLYGNVTWETPHILTSLQKAVVVTNDSWINFDVFKLRGNSILNPDNQFALLDPYNFKLNLSTTSDFLIDNNKYYLRFNGDVVLPEIIAGTDYKQGNVKIPFIADQLYYITHSVVDLQNNILPLQNSNLVMAPTSYVIDLSETESPLKLKDKPEWKGVYFPKFLIEFNRDADKFGELIFTNSFNTPYELKSSDNYKNWIGADGLNLSITKYFSSSEKSTFNKFPSNLNLLKLEIEKNSVQNSSLTGSIIIPFVSTTDKYTFTAPIMNTGFQPGYLDSLDGTKFKFNKGSGEIEIDITITRAVFASGERLDMTLDIDWPSLDVSIQSLTGFKAWGNYDIGFLRPNGTMAMSNQLNGKLRNYPVTFDGIGAGNSNGAYAFGLTGKAVLGEDVSGNEGPPSINIYSTCPNALLPKTPYVPVSETDIPNTIPTEGSDNSYEDNVQIIQNDFKDRIKQTRATISGNGEKGTLGEISVTNETSENNNSGELVNSVNTTHRDTSWANVKITLNFNQQKIINEGVGMVATTCMLPFNEALINVVNDKAAILTDKIDKLTDSLNIKIDRKIHQWVDSLGDRLAVRLKKDDFDPTLEIQVIGDTIANQLSARIRGNIKRSVNDNIKAPLYTFIRVEITSRTNGYADSVLRGIFNDIDDKNVSLDQILDRFADNFPTIIKGSGESAFENINMPSVKRRMIKIGEDAVGIKFSDIEGQFIDALSIAASNIVSRTISKLASDQVNKLGDKIFKDDGNTSASAGVGIKMNFEGLGRNLEEGRIDKIVKLDAVTIALNTKFVSFGGLLRFTNDDPVYGDTWQGTVMLDVKMPKKFALQGSYINGRKGEMPYWFCQISGVDDKSKPGQPMDKSAKKLSSPVSLGPVELVAASGRLYHHMTDIQGQPIVPDPNTDYGAGVNFVFFDASSHGRAIRLAIGANVEIKQDGNYVIDFKGDVQMVLKNPTEEKPDATASGGGGVSLNYNSAEEHFLGEGWILFQKGFCAKGNFMVDVKPGFWAVQVGTRDNMIMVTPGCLGWGAAGWAGINQTTANLGLGLSYSIHTRIGLDVGPVGGGINIDAGLAAGINATVQYRPTVKLLQAGIWVDLWANIGIDWHTAIKSGYINLVSINCKGDLLMTFEPPPTTLAGTVRGHIEILCFGVDFDAGFEKTLN